MVHGPGHAWMGMKALGWKYLAFGRWVEGLRLNRNDLQRMQPVNFIRKQTAASDDINTNVRTHTLGHQISSLPPAAVRHTHSMQPPPLQRPALAFPYHNFTFSPWPLPPRRSVPTPPPPSRCGVCRPTLPSLHAATPACDRDLKLLVHPAPALTNPPPSSRHGARRPVLPALLLHPAPALTHPPPHSGHGACRPRCPRCMRPHLSKLGI
eukprot:366528-Chlamydomonas_euryale.AAC.10